MKILQLLQKNLTWSIPAFMIMGIAYGNFYDSNILKSAILLFTFLMVYPMMVNLNLKKVFTKGDTKLQIVTQLINFAIIPFLGLLIGKMFFADSPLIILGLLLTSLLPTSGMTISWTGFAKGNMPAAVKMTVIGLIMGSILAPFYLQILVGTTIKIPLLKVFQQIAIIVFLPIILGYATQQFLIWKYGMAKYQKDLKKKFPPFSTLGVLSIVFIAMALKAKIIISEPTLLLRYLLPLVVIYSFNFLLSTIIGKYFFKRGDGIALVYGTVMRNLSIALAIAMTVFGENGSEIALIIALAYIIQVQAGAWYVKFTNRIFGEAPPDIAGDIMHEGVFALHNTDQIQSAIHLLEEEHIHSIAILNDKEKAIGLLTEEIIFNYLVDKKHNLKQEIRHTKLAPILNFTQQVPLAKVIKGMKKKHNYKVIITDQSGNMMGVITESDVLKNISKK